MWQVLSGLATDLVYARSATSCSYHHLTLPGRRYRFCGRHHYHFYCPSFTERGTTSIYTLVSPLNYALACKYREQGHILSCTAVVGSHFHASPHPNSPSRPHGIFLVVSYLSIFTTTRISGLVQVGRHKVPSTVVATNTRQSRISTCAPRLE